MSAGFLWYPVCIPQQTTPSSSDILYVAPFKGISLKYVTSRGQSTRLCWNQHRCPPPSALSIYLDAFPVSSPPSLARDFSPPDILFVGETLIIAMKIYHRGYDSTSKFVVHDMHQTEKPNSFQPTSRPPHVELSCVKIPCHDMKWKRIRKGETHWRVRCFGCCKLIDILSKFVCFFYLTVSPVMLIKQLCVAFWNPY